MNPTEKRRTLLWLIIIVLEVGTPTVLSQTVTSSNMSSTVEISTLTIKAEEGGGVDKTARPTLSSAIFSTTSNDTGNISVHREREDFTRWHCFDGPTPDPYYQQKCCQNEYRRYYERWYNGGYYLTTILERLQRWNCTEFEEECKKPTWPFSRYTKLMYNRFCDHDLLEWRCTDTVREVVQRYGFIKPPKYEEEIKENRWPVLIESLKSPQLGVRDLAEPCIQVAFFDRKDGGVGRFHEIVEPFFPFCGLQWAGYDYFSAVYREVSPWTGISLWCQGSIIVCMVVIMALCVATIVANATILGVFCTTPRLRNSQAVYKISLAAADLLVGLVIWPNMIVMQYLTFFQPRSMGKILKPPSENSTSRRGFFPFGNVTLEHRSPGGHFMKIFPAEYVRFSGFITMLALIVSIYTLMWASFDRFWAVFRPLRYNRHNAKKLAKISCGVLWAISAMLAVLPTFINAIEYSVTSAIFVTSDGDTALALIFVALICPLVITWVATIMTFRTSQRHARARQRITTANAWKNDSLERRLAKTLSLMVGIFSACVLPAILCTIAGFLIPNIIWEDPSMLSITNTTAYTTCEYVAIILLTSNSLWNCFIYSLRTRGFRQAANSIFSRISEKSGVKQLGQGAIHIIQGARRVSLSSLYTMRRFSGASASDLRKKSTGSLETGVTKVSESGTRPSFDSSSGSTDQMTSTNAYSTTYLKSGGKGGRRPSGVELRVERKKQQQKENEEYVGEDSTFGSFAVEAGTDRFFHSVMENVPEEILEDGDKAKEDEK